MTRNTLQSWLCMLVIACNAIDSADAFVAAGRWSTTASGDTGNYGQAATISWSLVPDGTSLTGGQPSRLVSFLDNAFGVTATTSDLAHRPWLPLLAETFDRWSELGGLRFTYQPHDDGAPHGSTPGANGLRGDVRLAGVDMDGPRGTLATSQFPDGGDITIDTLGGGYLLETAANYRRFRNVLMHEIGHAIGLDHLVSSDAEFLMEPELNLAFDGPQIDEIRGLHYLYGDRHEGHLGGLGNNSLATAVHLGSLRPGEQWTLGEAAAGDLVVDDWETDFLSISRSADADFFSFDIAQPGYLELAVTPLGASYRQGVVGGVQSIVHPVASSNLSLVFFGSHGQRLATADDHLHGFSEQLMQFRVNDAGRYFVQVRGTRQTVQLYQLDIALSPHSIPEPPSCALIAVGIMLLARVLRQRQ